LMYVLIDFLLFLKSFVNLIIEDLILLNSIINDKILFL